MFIEDHGGYDLSNESLSMFSSNSVAYIAGYVVKAMERSSRKCAECVSCLVDNQQDQLSSNICKLIELKNHGGLILPSKSCYVICEEAEKAHKIFTKQYGDSLNVQSPRFLMMTSVMDSLLPKATSLFPSIQSHLMETEFSVDNHFVSLVKDVTNTYITLKLHLQTATITRNAMKNPIRHKYTKQIQFQNQ